MSDDDLTRKEHRKARKRATHRDRSKFKKSDQKKWAAGQQQAQEQKLAKLDLSEGRVLVAMPEEIVVDHHRTLISCSLGGVLKKELTQHKTIIAVGDLVLFETESHRIASIQPRKTILSRCDNLRRRKEQIIAANIDQVLITVSALAPSLKPSLIDRYLIATSKGGMEPVIVINKIDLLEQGSAEKRLYLDVVKLYRSLGIPVIGVSVSENTGLSRLKQQMKNKASVFSGQSGVGKSSLINAVTGLSLSTGEMRKSLKGGHTTTRAQLIPLAFGGWCVDTPGIRSFGIWDLTLEDLQNYFPEITHCSTACRFLNCSHTHEPDCRVIQSVEEGAISWLRYESYLKLLQELTEA